MELYKTNDMALAAYLVMEGHAVQRMERAHERSRSVCWVFAVVGSLMDAVAAYAAEDALVDPLAYTQTLSDVRSSMYEFLQAG